jgi:hypothetical protein
MSHERLYTKPDGTGVEVAACSACPLRDECEEREAPHRARGRKPPINKACKLPAGPPKKRGPKPGTKLKPGLRRKRGRPAKAAAVVEIPAAPEMVTRKYVTKPLNGLACCWCDKKIDPRVMVVILNDPRKGRIYCSFKCLEEDLRTSDN